MLKNITFIVLGFTCFVGSLSCVVPMTIAIDETLTVKQKTIVKHAIELWRAAGYPIVLRYKSHEYVMEKHRGVITLRAGDQDKDCKGNAGITTWPNKFRNKYQIIICSWHAKVVPHEIGHALGYGHVQDPRSVMCNDNIYLCHPSKNNEEDPNDIWFLCPNCRGDKEDGIPENACCADEIGYLP